jgi:hypothetical protein
MRSYSHLSEDEVQERAVDVGLSALYPIPTRRSAMSSSCRGWCLRSGARPCSIPPRREERDRGPGLLRGIGEINRLAHRCDIHIGNLGDALARGRIDDIEPLSAFPAIARR